MANDIYDLVHQIDSDLADSYTGDEFHDKAVDLLEENGYCLNEESIVEVHETDPQEPDRYLEVTGEFIDDEISTYVSFVLEDSREEEFTPSVSIVSGLEEFIFYE